MSDNEYDREDGNEPEYNPASDPSESYWDSDEALDNLKMERSVKPEETNEQLTKRLLEEAAPQAAMSIIHIALHSSNDNTRFNASKYITEQLITEGASTSKQKWEDLVGDVVSEAELYANSTQEGE